MSDWTMPATHDWHIDTDGMELVIRRDEEDSVGVHLGHENIDNAHGTTIVTTRLLEMIEAVQPGALRPYLAEAWGEGVTTALQHLGAEVKWHDPIFERNPYREAT